MGVEGMTGWQFVGDMVLIGWIGLWVTAWIDRWKKP